MQGFHRKYATGAACQQRRLTPPDTWSCPTFGLACVLMSRPISPELVLSPDLWISNTPRYFSFPSNVETILSWTCHVYRPFEFRTPLGTSILLQYHLRTTSKLTTAFVSSFCGIARFSVESWIIFWRDLCQDFGVEFLDGIFEISTLHQKKHSTLRAPHLELSSENFDGVFKKIHVIAYLPGAGLTVIKQAVGPGRGFSIAL